MSEPSISDAKALATALRKEGVIILAFGQGKLSGASYGMRKADCRAMGKTLDQIVNYICAGDIEVPYDPAMPGDYQHAIGAFQALDELLAACKVAASAAGKDWLQMQLMLCDAIASAEKARGT